MSVSSARHAVVELVPPEKVDAAGLLAHVVGDRGKRDLAAKSTPLSTSVMMPPINDAETGLHVHDAMAVESGRSRWRRRKDRAASLRTPAWCRDGR